ncbi:MAG TPA: hypothetical protein VFR31_13635 [Thermoanaerobaculia bacterium]|nr:hypothetical protein [Thermoanaerobaculia bacterium]
MRRLCSTLALVAYVWMGSAAGAVPLARVSLPAEGMDLPAGSLAALEWEPLDGYEPERFVEWEAFLSVDGGAHYPLRITPHLDSDLRRILWQVPAIPTDDARLLLRFGDEREEVGVEVPLRFSISGPAALSLVGAITALSSPGEPARPGDSGVVIRIEGSRRGGSIRQVASTLPPGLHPGGHPAELLPGEAVVEVKDPDPDPEPLVSGLQLRSPPIQRDEPSRAVRPARTAAIPILLLTGRQNE